MGEGVAGGADRDGHDHGVLRPDAIVLGEETLVPPLNLVRPAPNSFTHTLTVDEPYWFDGHARGGDRPDGVLAAGTPVTLLVSGPELCRVIDAGGMYVEVRAANLRRRDGSGS
jgi:hypothetical protein